MSNISNSFTDTNVVTNKFLPPVGINLTIPGSWSIPPTSGAIAYDSGALNLFMGTETLWVPIVSSGGATGSTGVTGSTGFRSHRFYRKYRGNWGNWPDWKYGVYRPHRFYGSYRKYRRNRPNWKYWTYRFYWPNWNDGSCR